MVCPTSPADQWSEHLPGRPPLVPTELTAGGTLPAIWSAAWATAPSAPTLLEQPVGGDTIPGDRWYTAAELEDLTRRAAIDLDRLGVGPGDRVLWSAPTSVRSVAVAVGVLRLGAVLVPANVGYTERELAHIVIDARPVLAVVDRPEQAAWVTAAVPDPVGAVGLDLRTNGALPGAGGQGPEPLLDRCAPEDPALVVYTSGTTGAPKGAVLSHGNLVAGAATVRLAWGWQPDDRLVLALPLFHVHGLCIALFGTLAAGASAVLVPRFEAASVLVAAEQHRATLFFGVPTMYHRLVAAGRAPALARLRLCVSGSAPLPAALWARARAVAGVEVLERYGMTETLLTISNPLVGPRRPGTVGLPLPGTEIRIRPGAGAGPGSGSEGDGDGDGELQVRGPTVFGGYWERPAATAECFEGGWFATGDVVGRDAEGYVAVRGRHTELVITGGFNVYPTEVEDVLLDHPGVAEVAVTGTPSEEWGEAVTAWIVPAGDRPSEAALLEFAAGRLAPHKRPRLVHLVEQLPRNALGKVIRSELR